MSKTMARMTWYWHLSQDLEDEQEQAWEKQVGTSNQKKRGEGSPDTGNRAECISHLKLVKATSRAWFFVYFVLLKDFKVIQKPQNHQWLEEVHPFTESAHVHSWPTTCPRLFQALEMQRQTPQSPNLLCFPEAGGKNAPKGRIIHEGWKQPPGRWVEPRLVVKLRLTQGTCQQSLIWLAEKLDLLWEIYYDLKDGKKNFT